MVKQRERTKLSSNERKQQILKAAGKVFAAKGFHGATTSEIAKEAGIAEGTIFRYFKTKKDLLIELASSLVVDTLTGVLVEVSGKTDEEVLKALIFDRLRVVRPNLNIVKFLFYEAQFHPDVRQMIFGEVIFKASEIVKQVFAAKIKEGVFRDIDILVLIRSFVGMVLIYVIFDSGLMQINPTWMIPGSQEERDQYNVDLIVDIFLNGVRPRNGGI